MHAHIVRSSLPNFTGDASLYRLEPPATVDGAVIRHVVVSATIAPYSGAETPIFPAGEDGHVTSWGELDGSFRGDMDHAAALRGFGYDIVEPTS